MNETQAAERELQARRIHTNRPKLAAGTEWLSSSDKCSMEPIGFSTAQQGKKRAKIRSLPQEQGPERPCFEIAVR
jgi:hypothetical protein